MIFETKKIKHDTLSEYLVETRNSLQLSISDVVEKTGIQLKFLESLERGNFAQLPADVYVMGILRQLARFYVLDASVLVDQFKVERGVQKQLNEKSESNNNRTKKYFKKILITPRYVTVLLTIGFTVVTLVYVIWQVFSINRVPALEIYQPQDRQIVKESTFQVIGKTDPSMSVNINEQSVFVDEAGNFKTTISIESGPKELVFTAKNKFDKSVVKKITIIGQNNRTENLEALTMLLHFTSNVTFTIAIDQQSPQSFEFVSGDSKTFLAKSKIVITTSNAGATEVSINGQSHGVMGRSLEKLTNVVFFSETPAVK